MQPLLGICPSLVTEEMNHSLTEKVTMDEVKAALFQLGEAKALALLASMANSTSTIGKLLNKRFLTR